MLLAYGIGDAGTGMAASLIGFYLFIFYTSAAGLPAWMAGLVLMLARLWDAINDPLVGWLSDKTRYPLRTAASLDPLERRSPGVCDGPDVVVAARRALAGFAVFVDLRGGQQPLHLRQPALRRPGG